jgi:hypothetical protein
MITPKNIKKPAVDEIIDFNRNTSPVKKTKMGGRTTPSLNSVFWNLGKVGRGSLNLVYS